MLGLPNSLWRSSKSILMILLLVSCTKVGPDYARPYFDLPKDWRYKIDDARFVTNTEWWRQFGDPVLDSLIDDTIRNNLDIRSAIAVVDQYMGKYGSTRANLLPQTNLNLMYNSLVSGGQASNASELPTVQSRSFVYAGAGIQWQIDLWGQLRRGLEVAEADLSKEASARDAVILTVVSETASQYLLLRSYDRAIEITNSILDVLRDEVRIAKAKLSVGYISELELLQAESEFDRRSALIPEYRKKVAQCELALSLLLGRNPGNIKRGNPIDQINIPSVPAGLPSDLLRRRPDVNQAEQSLISSTAKIGYNIGNYFPQINLLSNIGTAGSSMGDLFTPAGNFISLGSVIVAPILSMGKNAGMVHSAEAQAESSLALFQKTIKKSFKEFEEALVSTRLNNEKQSIESNRVYATKNYIHLSKLQYDEGLTPYITVLDSLRQAYDAEMDLLNARQALLESYIQLYKAMGGGWITTAQEKAGLPKPRTPDFYP